MVIEVRTSRLEVAIGYYAPKSKQEAAERGAAAGAVVPAVAVQASPWGLLAAPVTIPLGALFSSASGMSDAELTRCAAALSNETAHLQFVPAVTAEMLRLGRLKTPFRWRMEGDDVGGADTPRDPAGNVVAIEVFPASFSLSPWSGQQNGVNPPLELVGEINCVIYAADKVEHFAIERFGYHSPARQFREWATSPGLISRETERCNQQLARKIVADLFEVKLKSSAERRGRSKGGL
jgi:hypothetical protein